MSRLRVLVVGASIAGPTAAYWFAKAGATVTVIERFPRLRTNGQNVDIRTVGVSVMRKMPGMEAAVRAKLVQIEGISLVRDDGRPYGIIRSTGNPDQQSLISEYEIYRGDLSNILFDLTKDNENVKYVFDEQLVSISQGKDDDGPVTVEFANHLPAAEYDLVVACDGATSRTRAIGLECGVRDHVQSTNCWAAYFSIDQDITGGSKVGQGYSAPGGRFVAVDTDSKGLSRVIVMAIKPSSTSDATLPFREASKQGTDSLKRFIAKHYEGVGWKVNDIVKGMMETDDFYASEFVQVKAPSLSKGRFVLVGDAGYAPGPTGTGTSLALAGAYLLAGEICRHKGNVAAGLRGYEEAVRPLVNEMQQLSPLFLSFAAPQTKWGVWLRNNIFTLVAWTGLAEFAQKYLASAFADSSKYKLPEYDWVA